VDTVNLITIAEAADRLGVKPGDVWQLISTGEVRTVQLVDATSLPEVA
jgi:hypothetical protein